MPTTATTPTNRIAVSRIELEFTVSTDRLDAHEFAGLLRDVANAIAIIARAGWGIEGVFNGTTYLALEHVQFGSPLTLLGIVPKLPDKARAAVIKFFTNVIFYEEEKNRRRAEAALGWEQVYAKRIENVRAVVDLMPPRKSPLANRTPEDTAQLAKRLMDLFDSIQENPATLKRIDLTDEN